MMERSEPPLRTVIVVDDDPAILRALGLRLEKARFKPVLTLDGREAVALACAAQPAAIILDLRMPLIHGFEVLEQLQSSAATAGIPAIILSADGAERARLRALRSGATFFVEKPYRAEDLIAALQSAVRAADPDPHSNQHTQRCPCP